MSRGCGTAASAVLVLAILLGSTLSANAQLPAGNRPVARRDPAPARPVEQRQVVARQIGFEAQQQGYAAKVQGAASQNVLWVVPQEEPSRPPRKSWLASWMDFFDLSD